MPVQLIGSGVDAVLWGHLAHLRLFSRHGVNREGWFDGEMLSVLDGLKGGVVVDYDRQTVHPNGAGNLDFTVQDAQGWFPLEIKAWMCNMQASRNPYDLRGCCAPSMLAVDVDKLWRWPGPRKYLIGFCYPRPSLGDWQNCLQTLGSVVGWPRALGKIGSQAPPPQFRPLTNLSQGYPPEFFTAALEVTFPA